MKPEIQKINVGRVGVSDAVTLGQVKEPMSEGAFRRADALAFLRAFLAHPLEIASIVPSSVFLEDKIVRAANLQRVRCAVELGPGTGGTTRALLRGLAPQARMLAIDLNPDFCDRLSRLIDDPRLAVHTGSAAVLGEILQQRGFTAPDLIVSGIPFSTLPRDVAERAAADIADNLAPGGRFVAYQYRRGYLDRYINPLLGEAQIEWEWRAIPPMRVFVWDKPAG